MKVLILAVLGVGTLAGAFIYLSQPQPLPVTPGRPLAERDAAQANSNPLNTEPPLATQEPADTPPPQPSQARPRPESSAVGTKAALEAAMLDQAIEVLVSPRATYAQKQAVWKQLGEAGKLDQAIAELEKRMAADPRTAEYPAALGQAYLRKCAGLQDVREQGILALQADQLFDTALSLDPSNWEARFTKAVAMSYWPASMNKGEEVIEQFQTLIQQQEAQTPQPNFAQTYVWLGDQYQKSGQTDAARAVWERGASLFPSQDDLKNRLAALSATPNPGPAGGR